MWYCDYKQEMHTESQWENTQEGHISSRSAVKLSPLILQPSVAESPVTGACHGNGARLGPLKLWPQYYTFPARQIYMEHWWNSCQ